MPLWRSRVTHRSNSLLPVCGTQVLRLSKCLCPQKHVTGPRFRGPRIEPFFSFFLRLFVGTYLYTLTVLNDFRIFVMSVVFIYHLWLSDFYWFAFQNIGCLLIINDFYSVLHISTVVFVISCLLGLHLVCFLILEIHFQFVYLNLRFKPTSV